MNDVDQARLDECPEPDWELEDYAEHCDTVHDGAPCSCPAAVDGLRVCIHQHLRKYPLLTVHEIGRALKASDASVRRRLQAMQEDGDASPETGPKCEGDPRPVTRWTAT